MRKNQHVVSHPDDWGVRGEGNEKVTRVFDTQHEAIDYGRQQSINQKSELLIHRQNGEIRERNSYGNDPSPPKG